MITVSLLEILPASVRLLRIETRGTAPREAPVRSSARV